jgi:hypothetical protein
MARGRASTKPTAERGVCDTDKFGSFNQIETATGPGSPLEVERFAGLRGCAMPSGSRLTETSAFVGANLSEPLVGRQRRAALTALASLLSRHRRQIRSPNGARSSATGRGCGGLAGLR